VLKELIPSRILKKIPAFKILITFLTSCSNILSHHSNFHPVEGRGKKGKKRWNQRNGGMIRKKKGGVAGEWHPLLW